MGALLIAPIACTTEPTSEPTSEPASEPASGATTAVGSGQEVNTQAPVQTQRLIFIHHSCGSNWLSESDGGLAIALNDNNYFVSEVGYGWSAEPDDDIGNETDTGDWPEWFTDVKMPYVYGSDNYYNNSIDAPDSENNIIMFKSCYPLSEVGESIEDEQTVYTGLLNYFAAHQDKLFVLITPPGETVVSSFQKTRELCDWLVDSEGGWLAGYEHANVFVYDFYCTLSEELSHHRVVNGLVERAWANNYDGVSPYHNGENDHPNDIGNQKATVEFLPMLNAAWNRWQGND